MLYLKMFIFIIACASSVYFFMDDAKHYLFPKSNNSSTESITKKTTHAASQTLIEFYKLLEEGNCKEAMTLRPDYTLDRCKKISQVDINDIQLKILSEDTATVYIDIQYKQMDSDEQSSFTGNVELGHENSGWFITENFVSTSESEQAEETKAIPAPQVKKIVNLPVKSEVNDAKQVSFDSDSSNLLLGKFEPSKRKSFSKIDVRYSFREGMYMNTDAYSSFKEMHQAAAKDGVNLTILSAARNFLYQKGIWEGKWTGSRKVEGKNLSKSIPNSIERAYKILENSSMPGSSRHHWGTDIDLNSFDNSYFSRGKGKLEYEWLTSNAYKYGFCQPYSSKSTENRTGYNEEKWHWSYLPLSKIYLDQSKNYMSNEMFSGFLGADTAVKIDIVGQYVLGIGGSCER